MSDNTPHGQDDDRRPDETNETTSAEGATSTPNDSLAADDRRAADHTDVIEPAAANETDVLPRAGEQATSQYTAPYPAAGAGQYGQGSGSQYGQGSGSQYGQGSGSQSGQQSPYGAHGSAYGQQDQSGSGQGSSQYGQSSPKAVGSEPWQIMSTSNSWRKRFLV